MYEFKNIQIKDHVTLNYDYSRVYLAIWKTVLFNIWLEPDDVNATTQHDADSFQQRRQPVLYSSRPVVM